MKFVTQSEYKNPEIIYKIRVIGEGQDDIRPKIWLEQVFLDPNEAEAYADSLKCKSTRYLVYRRTREKE